MICYIFWCTFTTKLSAFISVGIYQPYKNVYLFTFWIFLLFFFGFSFIIESIFLFLCFVYHPKTKDSLFWFCQNADDAKLVHQNNTAIALDIETRLIYLASAATKLLNSAADIRDRNNEIKNTVIKLGDKLRELASYKVDYTSIASRISNLRATISSSQSMVSSELMVLVYLPYTHVGCNAILIFILS